MTNERAIEHIRGIKNYLTTGNPMWNTDVIEEACGMAIKALEEPERKTGHWIKVGGFVTPGGDPVWRCSECGKGMHIYGVEAPTYAGDVSDHQWVSCPNCDAKMVGESE